MANLAGQPPRFALTLGVVLQHGPQPDICWSAGCGQGTDADVDRAVGQRKYPAVATEDLRVGAPQFQMGGNPGIITAVAVDVAAGSHSVGSVPVPDPSEASTYLGFGAIGNHEPFT